ncbi:MAG: transposase [Candidatus Anammoxibacter sp.]
MAKYKNKYRIESHRMPGWDYSSSGAYFITICVQNRVHLFGEIGNAKIILNEFGEIAFNEWEKSSEIRSEIALDEFVVMPNHLHGIVIINNDNEKNIGLGGSGDSGDSDIVETHGRASLRRRPKSISSFAAGYKSSVTTLANKIIVEKNGQLYNRKNKLWQANFHDRIIRNESEFHKIKQYIINNPINWETDRNNKDGLWI